MSLVKRRWNITRMVTSLRACRLARFGVLLLPLTIVLPIAQSRSKTDVLIMKNGDRITGEIKKLDREQLLIKPPYMSSTIALDWNEVERIESKQLFQVILTDGSRLYGSIRQEPQPDPSSAEQPFIVEGDDERQIRTHEDVTAIKQLGGNFWEQLDFAVDFGYSFLKSDAESQATLNARVERLSRKNFVQLSTSSYLTRRSDGANNNRHNGKFTYLRIRSNNWFYGGLADFLQSDQQQLDLRTTVGGVAGHYMIATTSTTWGVFGGVVLNRETFANEASGRSNTEVLVGTNASWYQFDSTEIRSHLQVYPSVTEGGRYRVDFDTSAYLDVWGDLYLRLGFFDNFDSRPPIDAPRNDFGVSTTVGWSF